MKRIVITILVPFLLIASMLGEVKHSAAPIAIFKAQSGEEREIKIFIKGQNGSEIVVDFENQQLINLPLNGRYTSVRGTIAQLQQIKIYGDAAAIKGLIINGSNIIQADLSQLSELEELHASYNGLTTINTTHNTQLKSLDVTYNQLSQLDVSSNALLSDLWVSGNALQTLDISRNSILEILHCTDNHFKALNLKNNQQLKHLYCNNNQLSQLDVSNNQQLEVVECKHNQLTNLDVSANTELVYLAFCYNQITEFTIVDKSSLSNLWCAKNGLQKLILSGCTQLRNLQCPNNKLSFQTLQLPTEAPDNMNISEQTFIITEAVRVGEPVELPNLLTEEGTAIQWKTIDGSLLEEGVDYLITDGQLCFINAPESPVFCEIQHASYGNMMVKSNPVSIETNPIEAMKFN